LFKQNGFGPFFFAERSGIEYLDVLEEFLTPIFEEESPDDMPFQQDGSPPHFYKEVTDFLKISDKYIGRSGPITLAISFT
jgi:hypothetical protein